jgi:hypothetical protein
MSPAEAGPTAIRSAAISGEVLARVTNTDRRAPEPLGLPAPTGEPGHPPAPPAGRAGAPRPAEGARHRLELLRTPAPTAAPAPLGPPAPARAPRPGGPPVQPAPAPVPRVRAGISDVDVDELYDALIERLRRELLLERERMGNLFGL